MRDLYFYLYLAIAFVAGAMLLGSGQVFAYQSSDSHAVIPTVSSNALHIAAAPVEESQISQNWAGYVADTAQSYTAVGASWTIPSVSTSNARLSTDATWVGIGGVKSNDLIQAGTQAIIQNGQVSYEAWYEALPGYQQTIPVVVSTGDAVTVSLAQTTSNEWTISFSDQTTGKSYTTSVSYDSSLSSAEWIEEMPVMESYRGSMSYIPLDNFGTVTFSGAYTVANGQGESLQASGVTALTMASGRQTLATPSVLADDSSFSVTRSSAQVSGGTGMQVATSYNPGHFRRHEFSSSGQPQTFSIPGGTITITIGM